MTEKSIPPRPALNSPEVRETAVESIMKPIVGWLQEVNPDLEAVKRDLLAAFNDDGFQFAMALDSRGWEPDAELVEILDGCSRHHAYTTLVTEWVSKHSVTVPFKVGDRVTSPRYKAATIVAIKPETARLVIQNDDERERWAAQPESGYIINFEEATTILGTIGERAAS